MTDRDPLDDLLRDAFAADRAWTPPVHVADGVMVRIRRRQRARTLILAAATAVGLVALGASIEPALGGLLDLVNAYRPAQWLDDTLALTVLVVAGTASLMLMDWEWS